MSPSQLDLAFLVFAADGDVGDYRAAGALAIQQDEPPVRVPNRKMLARDVEEEVRPFEQVQIVELRHSAYTALDVRLQFVESSRSALTSHFERKVGEADFVLVPQRSARLVGDGDERRDRHYG